MKSSQFVQIKLDQEPLVKTEEDFEVGAACRFFPEDLYKVLHQTRDFTTDTKRYVRTSPDPGFQFEIRHTNVNFWVECKYRENKTNSDIIKVFNDGQLNMMKSVENAFLFLCTKLHGEICNYLIPFKHISDDELNFSFIEPYRLNYGLGVRPGMIHQYLRLEYTNPSRRF